MPKDLDSTHFLCTFAHVNKYLTYRYVGLSTKSKINKTKDTWDSHRKVESPFLLI